MTHWNALRQEVTEWQALNLRLPLWWRDDDAIAPTPQLERLLRLSQDAHVPVHLAVIPAKATPELAEYMRAQSEHLKPIVHGWAHDNHAMRGEKRSEFGTERLGAASDAARGLARLRGMFGAHLEPVFVPPWNRIHPVLVGKLPDLGYQAISTFTPRTAKLAAPGLEQINTHLDPVDWHGTRGLAEMEGLIAHICTLLQDRRFGRTDASEPLGLLTHHLIHGEDVWTFCAKLLATLGPIAEPRSHLLNSSVSKEVT